MRKTFQPAILGIVVVIMTTPAFSLSIDPNNPEHYAAIAQRAGRLREAKPKALAGDDTALREVIRVFEEINAGSHTPGIEIKNMNELMEFGISKERLIKVLEGMIRENVSVIKESEKGSRAYNRARAEFDDCMMMLDAFPDYEILPLLKEFDFKDEFVNYYVTRRNNTLMEKAQEQPKQTNDVTPKDEPPVITDEAEQPIQETTPIQPQKSSSKKPLLWVAVIALLAIIGGVMAWWKKP